MKRLNYLIFLLVGLMLLSACSQNKENKSNNLDFIAPSIDLKEYGENNLLAKNEESKSDEIDGLELTILDGNLEKIELDEEKVPEDFKKENENFEKTHYLATIKFNIKNNSKKELSFEEVKCILKTSIGDINSSLIFNKSLSARIKARESIEAYCIVNRTEYFQVNSIEVVFDDKDFTFDYIIGK